MTQESHGFGSVLREISQFFGAGNVEPGRRVSLEVLFGLLGYLAKIDSLITSHEADYINHMMDELKLSIREREVASEALQRGRNREIDLQNEFRRFRELFKPGSTEVERLYNALIALAAADERLRPKERQFLETVTVELGYEMADLDARLARFRTKA